MKHMVGRVEVSSMPNVVKVMLVRQEGPVGHLPEAYLTADEAEDLRDGLRAVIIDARKLAREKGSVVDVSTPPNLPPRVRHRRSSTGG